MASETEGLVVLRSMESMRPNLDFKSRDVQVSGKGQDGRERVVIRSNYE